MLLKIIVFGIALATVIDAEMQRCCDSGGLMRHVNGSVECRKFILPSTLNEAPAYLNVSIDEAVVAFPDYHNIKEGYLCREIVFDKKTGLVMNTIITVTDHANETEQTFTELKRYQVKRCCQLKSYHSWTEISTYEKDCTPFSTKDIEPLGEFSKYYVETDYESKLECSSLKCFGNSRRLYILGDTILDKSLQYKYPEVANIMNEIESINYCLNNYIGPNSHIRFCVCPEDYNRVKLLRKKHDTILESILEKEEFLIDSKFYAPAINSGLFLVCNTNVDNSLKPWFNPSKSLSATSVIVNFATPFDAVPRDRNQILTEILKNKKNSSLKANIIMMCPKENVRVVENVTILDSAKLFSQNLNKKLEISEHCLALSETGDRLMAYFCDRNDINDQKECQCSCSRSGDHKNMTIIINGI